MADFQTTESLTTAPPPPPEVKVRTMRSDLASMAKSGGGLPQFQNVKVNASAIATAEAAATNPGVKKTGPGTILAIALLSLFIVAALGYFAYRFLVK